MSSMRELPSANASRIFVYLVALLTVSIALLPPLWMAITSFKTFDQIYTFPPSLIPDPPTLRQFAPLWAPPNSFGRLLVNSLVVTVGTTLFGVSLGALTGFAIARGLTRWRTAFLRTTLLAYVFPPILLAVPLFVVISSINLSNSRVGLILANMVIVFPFATWMMTAYFAKLPREIEEAALVDGASRFRVFWSVALPVARPGLAAVAIFTSISTWNEFLFALVIAGGGDARTVAVGLSSLLRGAEGAEYGLLMAGSTVAIVPMVVLFVAAQRYIVGGLATGAVKE